MERGEALGLAMNRCDRPDPAGSPQLRIDGRITRP
jgi:hypothetical protein